MDRLLEQCRLCPRNCKVNRAKGQKGYCGETGSVRVARASLHMWEEPCISGTKGSGTIFFSGCPLKCVFCQNKSIALGSKGRELTTEQLAQLFLLLQDKEAHNINLVTPTHFVPEIAAALQKAKLWGLAIPIVYNTASYEMVDTLKHLDGLVDIYLADLKYKNSAVSARYSNARDYFTYASVAVSEMLRQAGKLVFDSGLMKSGVIVRHMVMPGNTRESKEILRYLHGTYGDNLYLSIMNQYTPPKDLEGFPEISRKITSREYEKVINYAISLGIENAFIQEGETAVESFIPDFDDGALLDGLMK